MFWSVYNKLLNNKNNTNIPPILENGTSVSNFQKKAEIFNKYFAKQCIPLENDSSLPADINPLTTNMLDDITFNENDILRIIHTLNQRKPTG